MKHLLAALILTAAACSGGGSESTAASDPAPTVSEPGVTTSTPPVTEGTAATEAPATTEAPPTTTPPPAGATADFAITQVTFGDGAFVQITNIGGAPGDPGGHWLCQRPLYLEVPSISLDPGQSLWMAANSRDLQSVGMVVAVFDAAGGLGDLDVASGEMALYVTSGFGDPNAIVDYVEWGEPDHGRSSVATSAGIWPEGGFVATTGDTIAITSNSLDVDDPAQWAADIGV